MKIPIKREPIACAQREASKAIKSVCTEPRSSLDASRVPSVCVSMAMRRTRCVQRCVSRVNAPCIVPGAQRSWCPQQRST